MPTLQGRRSTVSSLIPLEVPHNVYGWTAKTANIGAVIRQIRSSAFSFGLEDTIQRTSDHLFWFSIGSIVMKWRWLTHYRNGNRDDPSGKYFPNFEMLDAKIASALINIIQNSHFKEKVSFEEQKAQKRRPRSTRKTDRFHDLRPLTSYWRSWYSIKLCWFILSYFSWRQHSGIRYEMGRSSFLYVKASIQLYLVRSVRIGDTRVCATQNRWELVRHRKSEERWPKNQKLKTRVKRNLDLRLRDYQTLTPDTEEMKQEQWSKIARGWVSSYRQHFTRPFSQCESLQEFSDWSEVE